MKRLKWVYICDECNKVALQERYCFMTDSWTGPPDGWVRCKDGDYCPECRKKREVLKEFVDNLVKEKNK